MDTDTIVFVEELPAEMQETHSFNHADGGVKIVHTSVTEAVRVEWSNLYSAHELQQRVVRIRYMVVGGEEATMAIEQAHESAQEEDMSRATGRAYHAWNAARFQAQLNGISVAAFEAVNPRP